MLQTRLRQLSPPDLQLLLFYMFSFDPATFLPLLPAGSAPGGLPGITRDMLVRVESQLLLLVFARAHANLAARAFCAELQFLPAMLP